MFILLVSGSFGQIGGGGVNLNFYHSFTYIYLLKTTQKFNKVQINVIQTKRYADLR